MKREINLGVSVIMLTYNREKYVANMIECILAQDYKAFEFIIVDNGSTDSSGKVAEEYAGRDERIRVIHRERGNIGSGRNAGLDVAQGEYIAFVDDDDECTPDFLSFLYSLAEENGADVSICGATWSEYDEKCVMSPQEALETLLWRKRYNVAFPTKLIRRELFRNNRFPETGKYDDIYLMPQILANAQRVAYHGVSKYCFVRHENNNSAWTQNHRLINKETLNEYLEVYRRRTEWLCDIFPEKMIAWKYFEWSFMLSMTEKIIRLELDDCYDICKSMKRELLEHKEEFVESGLLLDFEKEWVKQYLPG